MKLFVGIVAFLLSAQVALACSPGPDWPPTPQQEFDRADTVFIGTVTQVVRDGDFYITFEVATTYKGSYVADYYTVTIPDSSAECGYDDAATFTPGSVWVMYTDEEGWTTHLQGNAQYGTIAEARGVMQEFFEADTACIKIYQPVCGLVDTGIRCVTTPCPASEEKTFPNSCYLEQAGAEFLYEGECGYIAPPGNPIVEPPTVQPPVSWPVPSGCQSWYDGCNWCSRDTPTGPAMCTLRACMQQEPAYCESYFEGISIQQPVNPNNPVSSDVQEPEVSIDTLDAAMPVKKQTFVGRVMQFWGNFFTNLFGF